jgi:ferrochelatase
MKENRGLLVVNFGGPRSLGEISSFLTELLQDRDVVRTKFPVFFHRWFFARVARKRAVKIRHDYELIGGRSPIFIDTEQIAEALSKRLKRPVATFHRYLPATHRGSLRAIGECKEWEVLPLFPQFTYATTGSIARFLHTKLPHVRLHWIRSYPTHGAFVSSFIRRIRNFLNEKQLAEEKTILLFSAHGVPKRFVEEGDPYQRECEESFRAIASGFPTAVCKLSYQSKFGRGEWIRPYTDETCMAVRSWNQGRSHIVIVPLAFLSDHIETLFEIEYQYLPLLRAGGMEAYRCPALNLESYWLDALADLVCTAPLVPTPSLIRH